MQRDDYVLRMISQMARVLAAVRRMLLEGKHANAGEELETAARKGGVDLRFIIALEESSLVPLLSTGGEIDRPKCAFFAELVYLEWRRQLAMGNAAQAERCALRSLLLYRLAYEGIMADDVALQHIAELEGDTEPGVLSAD